MNPSQPSQGKQPNGPSSGSDASASERPADLLAVIATFESQIAALRSAQAERERWHEQASQQRSELDRARSEIGERERELHDQQAKLEARSAQVQDQLAQIQRQLAQAQQSEAAAERTSSEAQSLRSEVEASRRQLEAHKQALAKEATELKARSARLDEENRSLRQGREDSLKQVASLQAQIASMQGEIAELRARGEELAAEVLAQAENESSLAGRAAQDAQGLAVASQQRDEAQRRAEALGVELERAREQLRTASSDAAALRERDSDLASLHQRADQLQRELQAARAAGAEAEASSRAANEAQDQLARAVRALEECKASHQRLAAQLSAVTAKAQAENRALVEARSIAQQWEARALHAEAAPPSADHERRLALRRRRLERVRQAIGRRVSKLERAGELLTERYQRAEEVLAQREQVARTVKDMSETHRRIAKARARAKGFSFIFSIVAMLGLLAVLSWSASEKIFPQTYAARATVAAEARGRKLADNDLATWQRYHVGLASAPEFVDFLAGRFQRLGYADLASPGALRAFLDASLDVRPTVDGVIELDLRTTGRARAADILSAYVAAFQTRANQAREIRTDGASTIVSAPVAVDPQPITTSRPMQALALFGGTSVLALLAAIGLWKQTQRKLVELTHDEQRDIEGIIAKLERDRASLRTAA